MLDRNVKSRCILTQFRALSSEYTPERTELQNFVKIFLNSGVLNLQMSTTK